MANWIYSTSSLLFVYLFLAWLVCIKNESFPISLKYERLDCQSKRIFFFFILKCNTKKVPLIYLPKRLT